MDLQECVFQVGIPKNQRDFFRLFWFDDDNVKDGEIEIWHFKVHMWGVVSSPFTATCAIRQVAADNRTNASLMTTNAMQQNMYVDNLLKSLDSALKACQLYNEMKALFTDSGFMLTKWSMNSLEILNKIPEQDRALRPEGCAHTHSTLGHKVPWDLSGYLRRIC